MEFDEHIILCPKRITILIQILSRFQSNIIERIMNCTNFDQQILEEGLTKLDLMNLNGDLDDIGFLDIARGLVPNKLTKWLTFLGLDTEDKMAILKPCYIDLITAIYTEIWINRCNLIIALEKANNIFCKDKKKKKENKRNTKKIKTDKNSKKDKK